MVEIEDLDIEESKLLLSRLNYGHFACVRDDVPYVVPVHYTYDQNSIFIYTTEGKKTSIVRGNPSVCIEIEDVRANDDWETVVVEGRAEIITDETIRQKALDLLLETNPSLTPAISVRWMDNWVRGNHEVILRIRPLRITGRRTVERSR